jgi:hypothetical protein
MFLVSIAIIIIITIAYYKFSNRIQNFENQSINTPITHKIAFLFLTRDNLRCPDIWNEFFKGNEDRYTIYCHPKNPDNVSDTLLKNNIIPERIETCWGCIGIVRAFLALFANALKDSSNVKFITVSEACVPISSFEYIYKELMFTNNSQIDIHTNNFERYDKIINPKFPKDDFIKASCLGIVLNRFHAQLIVDNDETDNWVDFYVPDEHYICNMLQVLDSNFANNCDVRKITFDVWSKKNSKTISLEDNIDLKISAQYYADLEYISNKCINAMRENRFLFARKFTTFTLVDRKYLLSFSKKIS